MRTLSHIFSPTSPTFKFLVHEDEVKLKLNRIETEGFSITTTVVRIRYLHGTANIHDNTLKISSNADGPFAIPSICLIPEGITSIEILVVFKPDEMGQYMILEWDIDTQP